MVVRGVGEWNGPPKELTVVDGRGRTIADHDLEDERVYCVTCGTIFVHGDRRDCPSCTAAKMVQDLREDLVDAGVLDGDD